MRDGLCSLLKAVRLPIIVNVSCGELSQSHSYHIFFLCPTYDRRGALCFLVCASVRPSVCSFVVPFVRSSVRPSDLSRFRLKFLAKVVFDEVEVRLTCNLKYRLEEKQEQKESEDVDIGIESSSLSKSPSTSVRVYSNKVVYCTSGLPYLFSKMCSQLLVYESKIQKHYILTKIPISKVNTIYSGKSIKHENNNGWDEWETSKVYNFPQIFEKEEKIY